jgi:hypothetical protein
LITAKTLHGSLNMTSPTINGQYSVASEFYDMDDKMYGRLFCVYNENTIAKRRCYNPDSEQMMEELFDTQKQEC